MAHSSMGLQSQIPSPVAGGTRPTVPCQDQLQARFAVMLRGLAAAPIGRGPRCIASLCQSVGRCM
eukprot:scaffold64313_cov61-Phaeocystis_antarctica.AAC.2